MTMIGKSLGHHEILDHLGKGGMGEVYLARDTRLDREVALKVLPAEVAADPVRLKRFRHEAQVLASLDHPNIVTVFSVDEAQGIHFLTMARVRGKTLDEIVPEGGMDPEAFLDVAAPLVDAVAAAHARGVIHRDLKPANVMIAEDGRVQVLDFGLAKLLEPPADPGDATTPLLSQPGEVSGTVPYMSPEQIEGKSLDTKSDIFSLGVLFLEMLTGSHPFQTETRAGTLAAILRDPPRVTLGGNLPEDLATACRECVDKNPSGRPSAVTLRDRIHLIRQELSSRQASPDPSVAVLPFADLSPEKDQDYFCDGMAEEILNSLARIKGLRVASRTSTLRYKKTEKDSRTIGKELSVGNLLEGSVRKAGDRLRITAQLIDTGADSHLWSDRYDRKLDDVFAIQEDIAENIVEALKVALTPGETEALHTSPTSNAQAYDFYLRGRKFFYRDTKRDLESAREMFKRALEIDPDYVRALAGFADSSVYLYKHFNRDPEILEEAESAMQKALEIDPHSAEAHTSRGVIHWLKEEHEDAEREFETAIRLDPTFFETRYHMGQWSLTSGRHEDAVHHFTKASELLPEDYQSPIILGSLYRGLGRNEEADRAYRRGLEVAREHLKLNPDDSRAWYLGAGAMMAIGKTDEGLEWAHKAHAIDPENPLLLFNLAGIYAGAGRIEEGLDMAENAVKYGFTYKPGYENDPDLEPLRSHPRFQRLLERL